MPSISIIVPVFNSVDYLHRCIDSLLLQSLKDIEIIIVDDGSTDGSDAVCDSYNHDERVRVLHQSNEGLSSARNTGINAAQGEYVGFVDSDDYVAKNMYEIMLDETSGGSVDAVFCNYCLADTYGNPINEHKYTLPTNQTIYTDEIREILISENDYECLWFAWKGIYRRKLLIEKGIQFIDKLYGEDTPFNLEFLLCAKSLRIIDSPLYYYVQTPNSLVRTKYKTQLTEKLNAQYLAKKEIYNKYRLIGYEHRLYDYVFKHSVVMLLGNEMNAHKSLIELYRAFKQMRNCEMVKDAFEHSYGYRTIKTSIKYLMYLLKYRCYLSLSIVCKLKK